MEGGKVARFTISPTEGGGGAGGGADSPDLECSGGIGGGDHKHKDESSLSMFKPIAAAPLTLSSAVSTTAAAPGSSSPTTVATQRSTPMAGSAKDAEEDPMKGQGATGGAVGLGTGATKATPASGMGVESPEDANKADDESDDDEAEIVEESPTGRWLKRKEQVRKKRH